MNEMRRVQQGIYGYVLISTHQLYAGYIGFYDHDTETEGDSQAVVIIQDEDDGAVIEISHEHLIWIENHEVLIHWTIKK